MRISGRDTRAGGSRSCRSDAPKSANTIDITVVYKHGIGDADHWAGVRVTEK